jgi:chaperonin GroEL
MAKSISLREPWYSVCSNCTTTPDVCAHSILVQDVAQKTNEMAGDRTTTATVFASAVYSKGIENVTAGCNSMDIHHHLDVSFLSVNTITTHSRDHPSHRHLHEYTINEEIKITEGMQFDHGFISPYFVMDVKGQKVEFEKLLILLSEKKISLLQDILPSLDAAAQASRLLVIIVADVDGEALAACILNKLCGWLQVATCQGSRL